MTEPPANPAPPDPSGVRVPLLLSGIFNVLAVLGWVSTCILSFVAIPLLVLCIFEFMQYAKLGDPARRRAAVGSTRVIAILEICSFLLGNLPSMVCGIITLVNLRQLER